LASLITSGGRLLLALLEKCVAKEGGSYLFCDTDSLCIVASKNSKLVPCTGGRSSIRGRAAVKALSLSQAQAIARRFNSLNPYDPKLVRSLLKIEDINFEESDLSRSRPTLCGYAIAAKRSASESKRKKWLNLCDINLWDEKVFCISMYPDGRRNTVVPESFQIVLGQYLGHPEFKSRAPDGTVCAANTEGLLRRASIVAGEIVPIGKETDRRWEQGEDPSLVDYKVTEFRKRSKMVVAGLADRERWSNLGVRAAMRKSSLSQTTVYAILEGKPTRRQTLATFMRAISS
jgi:hypothetical protein